MTSPRQNEPRDTDVICPSCAFQFRAIPAQVQRLLLSSGHEPPFESAPALVPTEEPGVTKAQALEALDSMDDYARMTVGVDAIGPRECLRRFIEGATPHASTEPGRAAGADGLFAFLAHGDDAHRAWLKDACVAFFAGRPRPEPVVMASPAEPAAQPSPPEAQDPTETDEDSDTFHGRTSVLMHLPAERTVPWPKVTRYSGGADHGGVGARVWIRLADEGQDVEYVPAERAGQGVALPLILDELRIAIPGLLMDYIIACGELSKGLLEGDPMWEELQALSKRYDALAGAVRGSNHEV